MFVKRVEELLQKKFNFSAKTIILLVSLLYTDAIFKFTYFYSTKLLEVIKLVLTQNFILNMLN